MQKNINQTERVLRIAGGGLLSSLAFWGPKNPLFLGGMALAASGLVGTCPAYLALGVDSRTAEEQANDYMPVQSDSEEAAGHPFVGAS